MEVRSFERKHLHGVLGVCITAGITRKVCLAMHWGLGPSDDYPLIRACMPHDFFMLLHERSSFLQRDPAAVKVDRDHPAFGPKFANTIKDSNRLFKKWAKVSLNQCKEALKARSDGIQRGGGGAEGGGGEGGEAARGGGGGAEGEDLSVKQLKDFERLLTKLTKMERVAWDQRLGTHLMALCDVGSRG